MREHTTQTLLFGGDFTVGRNAEKYLPDVKRLMEKADFRMFQLEEPFLKTLRENATEDCLTENLEPIVGMVDLVTLAGNHFRDFGEQGVEDTLDWLDAHGIRHCGGGRNIFQASEPAFVEKDGVRVGVLAFNAIGSKKHFATEDDGGTAAVNFIRAFVPESMLDQRRSRLENDIWELKNPIPIHEDCRGFNFPDAASWLEFSERVYAARQQCDVLLVYFHKGYVHRPVFVDAWERLLAHMAIDNGADAVMASHSHIAHGVEMYKGRAIYHGLNNLVMVTPQLSPQFKGVVPGGADSNNAEWVRKRVERFGFVPDPEYPTYPFHPESVYCPVAKLELENGKVASYRMVLMKVEKDGVPYLHGNTPTGNEILDYMRRITEEAGLNAKFAWDGDEVVIS